MVFKWNSSMSPGDCSLHSISYLYRYLHCESPTTPSWFSIACMHKWNVHYVAVDNIKRSKSVRRNSALSSKTGSQYFHQLGLKKNQNKLETSRKTTSSGEKCLLIKKKTQSPEKSQRFFQKFTFAWKRKQNKTKNPPVICLWLNRELC